uniref:Uncharacterized protein n=1 Tax=Anguilla anguilla TaxID=7936 RepID=A0A0E9PFP5_ANGAN
MEWIFTVLGNYTNKVLDG